MGQILDLAKLVYRDYATDGVPSSGPFNPPKPDVRVLWATLETLIVAIQLAQGAGAVAFSTLAELNAHLAYPANTPGSVIADPTPANNGSYVKNGASGAGGWTQVSNLTLSGLQAALSAEVTRATAAEATLDGFIDTLGAAVAQETQTRSQQVGELNQGIIDAEHNIDGVSARVLTVEGWRSALAGRAFLKALTDASGAASDVLPRGSVKLTGARLPGRKVATVRTDAAGFGSAAVGQGDIALRRRQLPGRVFRRVLTDLDGFAAEVSRYDVATVPPVFPSFGTTLVHLLNYGQSLSRGQYSTPVLTTSLDRAYIFSGGDRADDGGADPAAYHGSLVPLVERTNSAPEGETPAAGALQCYMQIAASVGASFADRGQYVLASSPGQGGTTLAQLSSPGGYFQRLQNDISYGFSLATAQGWSYSIPAISFEQGENDYQSGTPPLVWRGQAVQLRKDVEAYYRGVTGQPNTLFVIVYQTGTHNWYGAAPGIALQQLDLVLKEPAFVMSTPMYFLPYGTSVHLTATGSKILGGYIGKALAALEAGRKPLPLHPLSVKRRGRMVYVRFNVPVGPLVFDTAAVSDPNGAKGFELWDFGGASVAIASVVLSGDTVLIKAGADISDLVEVRYADAAPSGYVTGSTSPNAGSRGCLRDSDPFVFDPTGVNATLRNWCVIFRKGLD